jgi:hypothetical protein
MVLDVLCGAFCALLIGERRISVWTVSVLNYVCFVLLAWMDISVSMIWFEAKALVLDDSGYFRYVLR